MSRRWVLTGALLVGFVAGGVFAAGPPNHATDRKEVQKLIKELGDDKFTVRQAATKRLSQLGQGVAPDLEKAVASPDREVRRRAEDLLREVHDRRDKRELDQLLAELDKAPLDKLVAQMAKDPAKVTDEQWKALGKIADAALARANAASGKKVTMPVAVGDLKPAAELDRQGGHKVRYVTREFPQGLTSLDRSFIVSDGDTKWINTLTNSVVIVNGDFAGGTGIDGSLIICRGNFRSATGVSNCVVLCGGKFTEAAGVADSVIQAGSFGRCTQSRGNVYINLPKVDAGRAENDQYVTSKDDPLRVLRLVPKKD